MDASRTSIQLISLQFKLHFFFQIWTSSKFNPTVDHYSLCQKSCLRFDHSSEYLFGLTNMCLVWRIHISPFDWPCPEKKTISIIIIKYQNQLLNPFQIDQLGYREYLTSQFFSSQNNNQHILRFHILLAGLAIKFKLICFCCDVSRVSISCKNFFS